MVSKYRHLNISYSPDQKAVYLRFRRELRAFADELDQRNTKIRGVFVKDRSDLFRIDLYGYDGLLKYQTNKGGGRSGGGGGERVIREILKKIDAMPMGRVEKKSFNLYTDAHPETTIKGTGFKDADTAKATIDLVEKSKKDARHKYLVIHTMFYRAKYHPHQTSGMRDAMKIFATWLRNQKQR